MEKEFYHPEFQDGNNKINEAMQFADLIDELTNLQIGRGITLLDEDNPDNIRQTTIGVIIPDRSNKRYMAAFKTGDILYFSCTAAEGSPEWKQYRDFVRPDKNKLMYTTIGLIRNTTDVVNNFRRSDAPRNHMAITADSESLDLQSKRVLVELFKQKASNEYKEWEKEEELRIKTEAHRFEEEFWPLFNDPQEPKRPPRDEK